MPSNDTVTSVCVARAPCLLVGLGRCHVNACKSPPSPCRQNRNPPPAADTVQTHSKQQRTHTTIRQPAKMVV